MKNEDLHTYVKQCIDCGGKTIVVDTREQPNGAIFRMRVCVDCGYRFKTVEIEECMLEVADLMEEIEKLKHQNTYLKTVLNDIHNKTNSCISRVCSLGGNKK